MKIAELLNEEVKFLSKTLKDRKKKQDQQADNAHKDYDTAQNEMLHKIFGAVEFSEFTTGANGGADAGEKYNSMMAKLGFTEMEVTMSGKPSPSYGPKPQLRTKWKRVGSVKNEIMHGNLTFYQLKDSQKIVVMTTLGGGLGDGIRYLYVQK